jgi:ElaB/YqjD/DUF883 family membrane-anchored ribosome-binding protein
MKDTEQVKDWLNRYLEATREVEAAHERYLLMRAKSQSLSSPTIDGTPHTKGANVDKIPRAMIRLEKLEKTIKQKEEEVNTIYDEIEDAISRIKGKGAGEQRELLRMRYLDLMKMTEVNEALFGRNDDFLDRELSYAKRTQLIHKKALQSLMELLPDCNKEKENET